MKLPEPSSVAVLSDSVLFPKPPKYKQTRLWTWGRQTRLGEISRASKNFGHEMWSWLSNEKVSLPSVAELTKSIAILQSHGFDTTVSETEGDAPIFVLSNGGRAGSTLLQRILITDPRLLLWGEPMGEMSLVSRLTEMVSRLEQPLKLLTWKNQVDVNSPGLAQSWIATLYPSITYFRAALRGIFDQWLGKPARDRGFTRWGFKEVRLGATDAVLLHWLYPNAKFVVTCRHPYDSYRSFRGNRWVCYYRYPEMGVDSAATFAHHWNRLATSWSELPAGFPCFRMKYEDLVRGKVDFRKLESWLGIEIKEDVALSAPVGGSRERGRVTWYERAIIAREAEAGMRALGYSR
jgi:Sulfotransferase family